MSYENLSVYMPLSFAHGTPQQSVPSVWEYITKVSYEVTISHYALSLSTDEQLNINIYIKFVWLVT